MTALGGKLPKNHGLGQITGELIDHPDRKHLVIAVVDCRRVVLDMDSGEQEPTARILRIECVRKADKQHAETLLRRALEDRHGTPQLPFDTEQELQDLFASIDVADDDELPGGGSGE